MRIRRHRRALLAVTTAVLALGLTACEGEDKAVPGPADQSGKTASAPAATGAPTGTPAPPAPQTPQTSQTPQATPAATTKAPTKPAGASADNTEEYAYKHPCPMTQLTLNVRPGDGSQRVIEVANKGTTACGLDILPGVDLGNPAAADRSRNLHPLVPGGIGGPGHALLAGAKAYAVLDLNPTGKADSATKDVTEVNVLVSPSHQANADTRNFPLGAGATVSGPKLGLYRGSVADAVASMKQADTPQS